MSQGDVAYRFFLREKLYFQLLTITTRIANMSPQEEPKNAAALQEQELESTDGGWDPYVASLLMSGGRPGNAVTADKDDDAPVMSMNRAPGNRGGK